MKYYCVAEIEVQNQPWVPEYVKEVTELLEKAGGKYLARTARIEKLEGEREPPPFAMIVEWPSREAALAFYEGEDYKRYRGMRSPDTRIEFLLIAGEDVGKMGRLTD